MPEIVGKKLADFPREDHVDITDLLLLGSNGTSSVRHATVGQLIDLIYPVGFSITTTDSSFDPNITYGGRWEREQGIFLFAADEAHPAGSVGGYENVTLTEAHLPQHSHTIEVKESDKVQTEDTEGQHEHYGKYSKDVSAGSSNKSRYYPDGKELAAFPLVYGGAHVHTLPAHSHDATCNNAGSGEAHSNMPPYKSVNMWRRVE